MELFANGFFFFFAVTVMSLENRFEFNTFVNKGSSFYVKKML